MEEKSHPLRSAVSSTLDRLRHDRAAAPPQLAAALDLLAAHLFLPELDVGLLRRATGVSGRHLNQLFRRHLGRTPRAYLEECRLTIGGRMLTGTTLPVRHVGELLGYSSAPVFSRAFARFWGERPSVYRRRARRVVARQTIHRALEAAERGDGETFAVCLDELESLLALAGASTDRTLHARLLVARAALAGPPGKRRSEVLVEQIRELLAD